MDFYFNPIFFLNSDDDTFGRVNMCLILRWYKMR